MTAETQTSSSSTASRLLVALGLLVALNLTFYLFERSRTQAQATSATELNDVGRQRMLSQRIPLLAWKLSQTGDPSERAELREQIEQAIEALRSSHQKLVHRHAGDEPAGDLSPALHNVYFQSPLELDKQIHRYLETADTLIESYSADASTGSTPSALLRDLTSQAEIVTAIEEAVQVFEEKNQSASAGLRGLRNTMFGSNLVVLLGVGIFVFRPIALQVKSNVRKLQTLNRVLEERTWRQKMVQETLGRQAKELARSNAELEQFAFVASHDLQEPLRKIIAFGDRLRTKCGDSLGPEGMDCLDRMQKATVRMQELINGLLTLSRVTSRAQPFQKVDLKQLVGEVLVDLEVRLEQAGARVDVDGLPAIDADPMQMRQLFQNLIGNALKFQRPDRPPLIKVQAKMLQGHATGTGGTRTPPHCRIVVQDNGIGFDPKHADRIFNVFQRLHNRRQYEGTGVGLSICRKIAERHGGRIQAKSQPMHGASFIVTIPAEQPKEGVGSGHSS